MEPLQNAPVNFFMGGGRYISDNFNMQLIDTSNPNAFDNLELKSILPDMMSEYIESEKTPEMPQSGGQVNDILGAIMNFFTPKKSEDGE